MSKAITQEQQNILNEFSVIGMQPEDRLMFAKSFNRVEDYADSTKTSYLYYYVVKAYLTEGTLPNIPEKRGLGNQNWLYKIVDATNKEDPLIGQVIYRIIGGIGEVLTPVRKGLILDSGFNIWNPLHNKLHTKFMDAFQDRISIVSYLPATPNQYVGTETFLNNRQIMTAYDTCLYQLGKTIDKLGLDMSHFQRLLESKPPIYRFNFFQELNSETTPKRFIQLVEKYFNVGTYTIKTESPKDFENTRNPIQEGASLQLWLSYLQNAKRRIESSTTNIPKFDINVTDNMLYNSSKRTKEEYQETHTNTNTIKEQEYKEIIIEKQNNNFWNAALITGLGIGLRALITKYVVKKELEKEKKKENNKTKKGKGKK